jgi:hypothetical protein
MAFRLYEIRDAEFIERYNLQGIGGVGMFRERGAAG